MSLNEFFWIFGIIYMVLIDGFRNARCWHRLGVYTIYVFKSFTLMARTMFDYIDENLYPESISWLKNHPKQTKIIDNVDRFGWYFVGGIAFISLLQVLLDPNHQYFIFNQERLSRDEIFNNNNNKKMFINHLHNSPIISPMIKPLSTHRKSSIKYQGSSGSSIGSSMISSHGGASGGGGGDRGIGGGLVIEVEPDEYDTMSNVNNHSITTDVTTGSTMNASGLSNNNEYGGYQYGYKILLKIDFCNIIVSTPFEKLFTDFARVSEANEVGAKRHSNA